MLILNVLNYNLTKTLIELNDQWAEKKSLENPTVNWHMNSIDFDMCIKIQWYLVSKTKQK